MCFDLLWSTRLWAKVTVLRLSHKILGVWNWQCSSVSRDWIHSISAASWVMLLYSASVLEHQDIRLGPRNPQAPEVDLLSSGSAVQSAPQNHKRDRGWCLDAGWIGRPWWKVPLRYLSILMTAFQCSSKGLDKNWHTLLTTKDSSGLVAVVYCKAPTIDLNRVGSATVSEPNLDNLLLDTIGVGTALAIDIFILVSKSLTYLVWERSNAPLDRWETSIPKK